MEQKYVSPILEEIRRKNFDEDLQLASKYALEYVHAVDDMRVYPAQ